jgi:dTDP-4-dehydrorhamnose reductase
VTGANGQLGCALRGLAPKYGDCTFYFTDVDTLDICDRVALTDYVRANRIGYLLNCAAYTAVDRAEEEEAVCLRINCDAVRNIGEVAQTHGVRVIHVSTDYVFDGAGTRPFREEDTPHPLSVYGQSKLAGETALLQACPGGAVVIRSSWLYSEYGSNFVRTMLRLGREREEVRVVSDQTGTPTYAADLAAAMLTVTVHPVFRPGIYHYSSEGACSWYDFAVRILALAGSSCRVTPIATGEYPVRAARPAYSVLSKEKIRRIYPEATVPAWETSLGRCMCILNNTTI